LSKLVTVLIPTHNRADVLPFAIESVLYQTFKDFEIKIVGDGCTDNTYEVVKPYLRNSKVKWFDLPKAKYFGYANRNEILKVCNTKYIAYLAHDDLFAKDHLQNSIDILEANATIDLVLQRALFIDEFCNIYPSFFNLNYKDDLNAYLNLQKTKFPSSCSIHRKRCFEKVGYLNEELKHGGDHDLNVRIINSKDHDNFIYLNKISVFHFKAIWRERTNKSRFGVFRELMNSDKITGLEDYKQSNKMIVNEQNTIFNLLNKDDVFINKLRYQLLNIQDSYISILEKRVHELNSQF